MIERIIYGAIDIYRIGGKEYAVGFIAYLNDATAIAGGNDMNRYRASFLIRKVSVEIQVLRF